MRRLALLLVLAGASGVAPAALAATTHKVSIGDNFYQPVSVTIAPNDTVRWTNEGLQTHTVTFTGERREDLLPSQSRTTTFERPGTYRYECRIHPSSMQGTVLVQGASSSTTSTTSRPTTTSTTQDARGSAITPPPDTSTTTTTTSTTTTTVVTEESTTTTVLDGGAGSAAPPVGDGDGDNVDGPGAVAALLLLAASGAAFLQARTVLR